MGNWNCCGKIGVLHSRSRSQQRFKMSVDVCPDDIFWTTEHFVTILGMVMQHHDPECHVGKKLFAIFKVKVTVKLIWLKYDSWSDDTLSYAGVSCEKKKDYCIQGQDHSKDLKLYSVFMYLLYHWSLGNQIRCADLLLIITKSSTAKWAYSIYWQ